MQTSRITPGKWYVTKQGEGKCLSTGKKLSFEIDGKQVWLSSSEVQHEIAKGEEPKPGEQPNEPAPSPLRNVVEMQLLDYAAQLHGKAESALYHWTQSLPRDHPGWEIHRQLSKEIDKILENARRLAGA